MATDNENKPQRRIEDRLPTHPLQWEGEQGAAADEQLSEPLQQIADRFKIEADADTDAELRAGGPKRLAFDYFKRGWLAGESITAGAARQGGNTNSNSPEFAGIKQSSTAPTVEVDEPDHDAEMFAMLEADAAQEGAIHEMEGAMLWAAHQGWLCAQRASKPPAREAAERQSIDTLEFAALLGKLIQSTEERDDDGLAYSEARAALIAHIDTWAGAEAAQPLAYIAPHVMESLRAGCHVATVLSPAPDEKATEAVYG